MNQKIFKFPAVVTLINEVRCICYPKSSYGGMVVYTNLPEYYEMKLLNHLLRKDDTFIDVGEGIGDYSLIAASKLDKGKVYAFEPDDRANKIFKENINLNDFGNKISLNISVVSDLLGEVYFTKERESEVSHISYNKSGVKRKSVTLDAFVKKNNIGKVKILKIDVEGAEMKVLKGARKSLNDNRIDTLIIEVNKKMKDFGYITNQLFSFLKNLNYKTYKYSENGKLVSWKNSEKTENTFNIIATRKNLNELKF